ncbi:MAG: phosphoglycerate dehydrogenase [Deltaproteobacteria bacterium]|nr:phosphoglycerate dehydrogenase [Deltaproteobacteria bacterium]
MSAQKTWKVLIPRKGEFPDGHIRELEAAGCEIVYAGEPASGGLVSEADLARAIPEVDGVILPGMHPFTRAVLEQAPRLRVLSKTGIGVETVDVDAATELGIIVAFTPVPEHVIAVAEGTVGVILSLVKGLRFKESYLREGRWKSAHGPSAGVLMGKTIGIVGFGRIGQKVAEGLKPWNVRILATDPYVTPEQAAAAGAELVPLEELLAESDVVSLHVVVTPETSHMIGEKELRRMKKTAFLINTSRGDAIDEPVLIRALKEGWIAGGAFDVFEEEPLPPGHPFFEIESALLTPHCIGSSDETRDAIRRATVENCLRALRGEMPLYVKNPQVLPRWKERFRAPIEIPART